MICPPLDIDAMYGAIQSRFSSRIYEDKPIRQVDLGRLCASVDLFDDARAVFIEQVPKGFFKGIIGSYFAIEGAPSAFVFIVKKGAPDALWHMGYLGEALVLEATANQVDSCWVAGSFSRDVASSVVDLSADEKIVAAVALGYGTKPQGNRKRKSLDVIGPGQERWPLWAQRGLAAAHIAPSAMNKQPWKFSLDSRGTEMHLAASGLLRFISTSEELDLGIAALHFELGAVQSKTYGIWGRGPSHDLVFDLVDPGKMPAMQKREASFPLSPSPVTGYSKYNTDEGA